MKVYRNEKTFITIILLLIMPIVIIAIPSDDYGLLGSPFLSAIAADVFLYLIFAPACWNVYLDKQTLSFRNEMMFYWKNKFVFKLEEIEKVEIIYHSQFTFVRVYWRVYRKKFYSIGEQRAKLLVEDLEELDVKVIETR